MKVVEMCRVVYKSRINPYAYDFIVEGEKICKAARQGQFLHIQAPGFSLRRPISICDFDLATGTVRFVFEVRGEGTKALAQTEIGDSMNILGPLGNGFTIDEAYRHIWLVGGGIGAPPLLGLASFYGNKAATFLGFRDKDHVLLHRDFTCTGASAALCTEDGSAGEKGLVTGLFERADKKPDMLYACGPKAMLRAVVAYARTKGIPCQVSLEERMACGIGACLGCACERTDGEYAHVCKNGPVFMAEEVVL